MRKSLTLLLIACGLIVVVRFIPNPEDSEPTTPPLSNRTEEKPVMPPAPLSMGQGIRQPTVEELEDEKRFVDRQVLLAGEWLNSADVKEQVAGAEQLSAYPTAEAEILLASSLTTAFDSAVRVAAAISLQSFPQASAKTLDALLAALADSSPEVQSAATNSLQSLATRLDRRTPRFKKIVVGMKRQASNRYLLPETRQSILEFIKDWDSEPTAPTQRISQKGGQHHP